MSLSDSIKLIRQKNLLNQQEFADVLKVGLTTVNRWEGGKSIPNISAMKKIKAKIAELDHWTDKQETKAAVDNLIRDTLWAELPECYDEISISEYRQRIYEYVYTRYRVAA